MYVTDRHDMILAVKVPLNPNTTNQRNPSVKLIITSNGSTDITNCMSFCLMQMTTFL